MNQEGMDDRAYFSDWGGCICDEDGFNEDCPLAQSHVIDDEEDEEDE